MNISQIENLIVTKSTEYLEASKRANKLMLELKSLKVQLEVVKKEEFVEYLKIGEEMKILRFWRHGGVPLKFDDLKIDGILSNTDILFQNETFKVIKKNKKSIVIEVTKFKRKFKGEDLEINNSGAKFRIDLDTFYSYYFIDETRKNSFITYIKRTIALQQILD
jgi:hypothetical protein